MKTKRGFSLALVLMVSTVILTVGLALGVMCSISLHHAQQLLASRQAELMARGVAAQLQYELDQRVWLSDAYNQSYPDMMFGADALKKRFETIPVFPDGAALMSDLDLQIGITFDNTKPYYSVDNLMGSTTLPGFIDVGTTRASVPPFSVDLVVTTSIEGNVRHRDIVLSRVWPTAAYCIQSPVNVRDACNLTGDVYDQSSIISVGGSLPSTIDGDLAVPAQRDRAAISFFADSAITGSVRFNVPPSAGASKDALGLTLFPISLPAGEMYAGAVIALPDDPDNISIDPPPQDIPNTIQIQSLSDFMNAWKDYKVSGKPIPDDWVNVMNSVNLAKYSCLHLKQVGLDVIYDHLAPHTVLKARGNAKSFLLADATLENGVFSAKSFTTRVIAYVNGAKTDVITATPTVRLNNALLIVAGDLDVENVSGNSSTLYVYGSLFLHGGQLFGKTGQGVVDCSRMLIWADSVIMEEVGGNFKGLITARKAMSLAPTQSGLNIRGALLSGGAPLSANINNINGDVLYSKGANVPLILSNTKLIYDPAYTKELNRFGTASLRRMHEIP